MANGLRMLLTAVTLLAVGCTPRPNSASPRGSEASTAARPAPRERRASQPGHATLQCERVEAGRSVAGRLIEAEVYGTGGSTVLILATIHGNEAVGTPLLRKLSAFLSEHPEVAANRRIVLVPVANPDGMAANRRTNANGVDLNRNFPASNHIRSPSRVPCT